MTRSMTGYGRKVAISPNGSLLIEIHSVNRRSLEIAVHAPKEFLAYDIALRKQVASRVRRGQVNVRITHESGESLASVEDFKRVHAFWTKVAQDVGIAGEVTLPFLAEQVSLLPKQSADMEETLLSGLGGAIDEFLSMKEREGAALVADIEPRLQELLDETALLEKEAPLAPETYREKLTKRLDELSLADDDRIARETVIFAEKSDITEELIRLRSHVDQFRALLTKKGESIGRECDFLAQEMIRETNTIASKAQALGMKKGALTLKSGIEKIREQVQNIE